jgi:hypothetical protein
MNKHNHYTTSYYLLLKKWEASNSKPILELSQSNLDNAGRKTAYPGNFTSSVRGKTVSTPKDSKIDPFAHLTPVARRFIENNEVVRTTKANSQNPSRRVNLSGAEHQKKTPNKNNQNQLQCKLLARIADSKPTPTNITQFTTTVMGPFRSKGGYSAPEQKKRDFGYSDAAQGPLFNSRIATCINSSDSTRTSPYSMKVKAQLPNVSKQRVQIKSTERQQHYPNALAENYGSGRSSNSSSKRRDIPKYTKNSFQVMNNFIQTSYGGLGNMNTTQMMNKTGYGSLTYENKVGPSQNNSSRRRNIYKAKQQDKKRNPQIR